MIQFEDIISSVGGFGLYQKILCFTLIPFTTGLCGLVYYAQLIVLSTPPFTCTSNQEDISEWDAFTDATSTHATVTNSPGDSCLKSNNHTCPQYTFSYSTIFPTLVSENEWVCDNAWRPYSILIVFWVGNMFGAWILGIMSDKYGRRPVILTCSLVYGVFGIASAFVTNYYGFLILRAIVGSVHHTLTHLPFILVIEFCDKSSRVIPLVTIMASYTLSSILATALAFMFWSWRALVFASAAPALILLVVYKFLPESASWELTQGRFTDATRRLYFIASINKRNLTYMDVSELVTKTTTGIDECFIEDDDDNVLYEKGKRVEFIKAESKTEVSNPKSTLITSIFKYPSLLRQIITVMVVWMISYMCYYGHTQNTSHLGDNIILNYFYGALVEVPAWTAPYIIEKIGRRSPLIATFGTSGILGILYGVLIDKTSRGGLLAIALFGRMTITAAYYIALQYGPEIFPTVIRGQGVALAETLGGVAIFLSPLIVYLEEIYHGLPLLIFGIMGIAAAAVTSLLPETKGVPLPVTLEQGNNAGKVGYICQENKNNV